MREVRDIAIEELIPQRPPVVMIDRLSGVEEDAVLSEFLVREENIFVSEGLLRESGVLENIAQTAAAMMGYRALEAGTPVKNGYIGGIKDLEIHRLPAPGERLETRVEQIHEVMGALIARGTSYCAGSLIARCEMKVFMEVL